MKRILAIGFIAGLATLGISGAANAAPNDAACFGQIHKTVNTQGFAGAENVGQLIKALGGGQEKNAAASGLCSGE
ncbi:hypothetical protein [Microbacterium sp. BK668]|uniref:hypothetical protein n=1 Tax=Microbacterium sp. BK668 TaxID=2512118 RepID=UPI0010601283|nr:hypothetical protein [Microbacterium sp. BK668]TDN92330.1 hypothetical protein EV279_1849 [Microbacterium sp. BK668]